MAMSEAEARKLTEQIKDNLNQSAKLIQKAHQGKIWTVLGYTSFAEWLDKTVGISRARGYQLLNIAKTEDILNSSLTLPEFFILTDRQTRIINKMGIDEFLAQVAKERDEQDMEDDAEDNMLMIMDVVNKADQAFKANDTIMTQDKPEPASYNHNATATNFYKQFLYQINDLPDTDTIEPTDYREIIADLEVTIEQLDKILDEYLLVEDN